MTQITARDESNSAADFCDCAGDAPAKAKMIFIRQEAVTQRDNLSAPAIALQKVKRHRRSMIEILSMNPHYYEIVSGSRPRNLIQQVIVEFSMGGSRWRSELREVAKQLRPVVGDKRRRLKWRVRRNQNYSFSPGVDDALR